MDKVDAIIRKAAPADRLALFSFDRQLTPLVTFDEWDSAAVIDRFALTHSRLSRTKPGWSATRMDQAILGASEMIAEADKEDGGGRVQIVVISDYQEGSKLNALQGQEWPKGVEVVSERVGVKTSNAGLQLLGDTEETESMAGVRVRVSNERETEREQFQVGWTRSDGNFVSKPTDLYVPAGQSRIVTLPSPEKSSGADRITLRGDDETFDNTVFSTPPEASSVTVVYLGNGSESDSRAPLYFVRRALQGTPRQAVEVIAKQLDVPLPPSEAGAAKLFIVTGALSDELAVSLRAQLTQGKTILFVPTSAAAAATLGNLLGQNQLAADEANVRNYAMLGEIDFRHPLFAPFADARYSDFTKIHFWKYRKLDVRSIPNASVVASLDNGDPAIADISAGKGRIIFFASGWAPVDSQLVLSTKFVPLLASALELGVGATETATQFFVGDTVPLAKDWLKSGGDIVVTLADASTLKVAAGETTFAQTTMPGIYHVKSGTKEKQFAVNLDVAESRTSPLPLDELERLGAPVEKSAAEATQIARQKIVLQSAELENHQKLWRWFIAATLGVLLIETGIAGWTTRRRTREGVAA
jgi:hypothetical protein